MSDLEQASRAFLAVVDRNYGGSFSGYIAIHSAAREFVSAALDAESGRVSVPIEPSEAMLDAGYRAEAEDGTPRDIWTAMLAAAQEGRDGS